MTSERLPPDLVEYGHKFYLEKVLGECGVGKSPCHGFLPGTIPWRDQSPASIDFVSRDQALVKAYFGVLSNRPDVNPQATILLEQRGSRRDLPLEIGRSDLSPIVPNRGRQNGSCQNGTQSKHVYPVNAGIKPYGSAALRRDDRSDSPIWDGFRMMSRSRTWPSRRPSSRARRTC